MLLTPLQEDPTRWHRTTEGASRGWWTLLASGVISIVAGVIILNIDWTVAGLAIFVGAYVIFRGLVQLLTGALTATSWPYFVGTGVATIMVGIVVLAWPRPTLFVIAIFLGVAVLVYGALNVAGALGNRDRVRYWPVILSLGVVEILLGVWLLDRPGLTLAGVITAIGFWGLFVGIVQVIVSFEIRSPAQT